MEAGVERLASVERALGKVETGLKLADSVLKLGEGAGLPLIPAVCSAARGVLRAVQASRTVISDALSVAQRTIDVLELLQLMAENVERMDAKSRPSVEDRMRELQRLLEDARSAVAAFGKKGWLRHALKAGRRSTLSQLDSEITAQLDLLLKFYNLARDANVDALLQAREYAVEAEVQLRVAERKAKGEAVDADALEKDSEFVRGIAVASGLSDAEFQQELCSEMREGFVQQGLKLDRAAELMQSDQEFEATQQLELLQKKEQMAALQQQTMALQRSQVEERLQRLRQRRLSTQPVVHLDAVSREQLKRHSVSSTCIAATSAASSSVAAAAPTPTLPRVAPANPFLGMALSPAGVPTSSAVVASTIVTITLEGSLTGPPPFDRSAFKAKLAEKLEMRPDEQFEVKCLKSSKRLYGVQTSPSFFVRVEVDEEGYLSYASSSSETASEASSDLSAAELDDEATTIQTAIRAAIKPQRKIGLEAIEVRWVEKGSIIICIELDLPYALKLLDLSERKDFKDELGLRSCVIGESRPSLAVADAKVGYARKLAATCGYGAGNWLLRLTCLPCLACNLARQDKYSDIALGPTRGCLPTLTRTKLMKLEEEISAGRGCRPLSEGGE